MFSAVDAHGQQTFLTGCVVRRPFLLSKDDETTKGLLRALAHNSNLRELDLSSPRSGGVRPPTVELVGLLGEAIGGSGSLRLLNLSRTPLRPEMVAALTSPLQRGAARLQQLNLEGSSLGNAGVAVLAAYLASNSTLVALNLSCNRIQNAGAAALAHALAVNASLRQLNVSGNWLREDGCEQLFAALRCNSALRALDVQGNVVHDRGAAALAAALARNTSLTAVDLTGCSIHADGALQLAHALRCSATLRSLDLSENPLGDAGVQQLATALAHPSCPLTALSLEFVGGLSPAGLVGLLAAVAYNTSLLSLNVRYNDLVVVDDDSVAVAAAAALRRNHSLCSIEFGRFLGTAGLLAVTDALQHNASLTSLKFEDPIDDTDDLLIGTLASNLSRNGCLLCITTPRQSSRLAPLSNILRRNRWNLAHLSTTLLSILIDCLDSN